MTHDAAKPDALYFVRGFTVYKNPQDYPGKYVARGWTARAAGLRVDSQPLTVADTLAEARAAIPPHYCRMAREPGDDPSVLECWV